MKKPMEKKMQAKRRIIRSEVCTAFAIALEPEGGRMPLTHHPSKELLERYSSGKATAEESVEVEEHLLICEDCRIVLTEFDTFAAAMRSALAVAATFPANRPLEIVHYTAEGPIYSRSKKVKKGRWLAVHEGRNLEGGRFCQTLRQANEYLFRSFVEMFPEHRCSAECGPVKRELSETD